MIATIVMTTLMKKSLTMKGITSKARRAHDTAIKNVSQTRNWLPPSNAKAFQEMKRRHCSKRPTIRDFL